MTRSAYEILGVAPSASDAEIRAAFRDKVRKAHPDQGGDRVWFETLTEAYQQIDTPAKRAVYARPRAEGSIAGQVAEVEQRLEKKAETALQILDLVGELLS